jgi:carbon-monoxide dehydrogenase large subunit
MSKYVGTSMKRKEDPRFIQGRGSYVANLKLANMAYLAIKRSPYAHAVIKKIDTSKASTLPGVLGVFTGEDTSDVGPMPSGWNPPGIKVPPQRVLQTDKVRHVGDRVAMVVAENPYIAQDALDLIEVDYEPLPCRKGVEKFIRTGKEKYRGRRKRRRMNRREKNKKGKERGRRRRIPGNERWRGNSTE